MPQHHPFCLTHCSNILTEHKRRKIEQQVEYNRFNICCSLDVCLSEVHVGVKVGIFSTPEVILSGFFFVEGGWFWGFVSFGVVCVVMFGVFFNSHVKWISI